MSILLTFFVILFAVLSFVFRARIVSLARGAKDHVVATWYDFLVYVWPLIRTTVIISALVFGGIWLLFIVAMSMLGVYANSLPSALVITFLLPIWFLAFIMPPQANKLWILGPVIRIVRYVSSPILVIAAIFLFVGIWSPAVKSSFDRWSGNKKQTVANSFDKSSVQSEAEAGTFGFLPEETWVYNQYGQPFRKLPQGALVRALDLSGVPVQPDSEGLVQVMLPNETGDFIRGNTGYIPSRKINWNWQDTHSEDIKPSGREREQQQSKSLNPFWNKSVHVKHEWTDENQGAVKIGTLEAGSYNLKVKSDFKFEEMRDGEVVMVVPIGPKGLVGRTVATQSQLPVPSAPFGARLVKIGDGPWQLLGEETTIHLTEKSDVYVTINMRRIPDNFYNQGGDDIAIKRSW